MDEAQRRVAMTIGACAEKWGNAMLLTRDTEGHTHVSTPPHTTHHTTHPRAMQRGGRGTGGCKGMCGEGRSMAEGGGGRVNGLWGVGGSENTKIDFSGDSRIGGRESTSGAHEGDGCSCDHGKHRTKQHGP